MKAKSRRRLLISSVAMLLVAMLALGTATFAWFTQNTTATADGIYAKTTKASTLLISKANHTWATSVTYTQGSSSAAQVMFPASSDDGLAWVEAIATDATGAYKSGTAKTVQPASTNAKFVYKEELNVMNGGDTGSPAINNVTISWTWPASVAQYARIALVPSTEEAAFEASADFKTSVYGLNTTKYNGLTASGEGEEITPKSTTTLSVGTLTAGQAKYYTLFVWFEGQDTNCKDATAGQTLNGLTFRVTGEPAAN